MKIAVDAMGGDHAPGEIVKGALEAIRQFRQEVILVGDEELIRQELAGERSESLSIVHAPEVIAMSDSPVVAVRRKKNSSLVKAVQLVREGAADAVVSAGNTGAVMAAGVLLLGPIPGIDRPAIATMIPNKKGKTLLLDAGANVDCKPAHLLQFGLMGYLYMKEIIGIEQPKVGLLSIGEEETKGNELTLSAFQLLRKAQINFIGNVEGRDIFEGTADVIVCDGFTGNIVLKASEGMVTALLAMAGEEIRRSLPAKIGMAMLMPALRSFWRKLDYAEYGGAPLLGLNGIVIICHGRSQARAIRNAIRAGRESVENNLVLAIKNCIQQSLNQKVGQF
ncbi:MAG: phosphate acyltransferase PlsX [Armatimonadetes bacterium]|nr:phosphate acyltransferase PlsX [Armatimonadota bacterium]